MCLEVYGFPKKKKVSIYKPLEQPQSLKPDTNQNIIPVVKKNQNVKIESIKDHNQKVLDEKQKRIKEKEKNNKKKKEKKSQNCVIF